ncbi:MAG TPA: bifunctional pyr operon transcriptional regulator/uracil phosphoribosyltransferase PyrR [Candidatus Micrarchaeia archaeon]|nr:bifunctional pyr operon transcriptional regulator/uracil phosphoribosyltransferase PyrR [Candidatus Micrarchaeia archaeon]
MSRPPAAAEPIAAGPIAAAAGRSASAPHRALDAGAIDRCCWRLARELQERHPDLSWVVLAGIQRRGVPLALRLAAAVADQGAAPPPVASLDVGPFRDDRRRARGRPAPAVARLAHGTVDARVVVLVDDVLFHGRTVRAALQAVHALGRPRAVELCVLVDRGHRQLPLRATYVGKNLPTAESEHVAVRLREVDGVDGVDVESLWPAP